MLSRTTCGQDADTAYFSETVSKFPSSVTTTTLEREAKQMRIESVQRHIPGGGAASGNARAVACAWLKTPGDTATMAGGAGR